MAGDEVTEPPLDPAGEARDRFEDAFARLQARSKRSAELNREGADFDTLTADHAELEMMRREAWAAKKAIVSRYEGATPDHVDTPVGVQDTTTFGRVFAVLGALLFAAIVPVAWFMWTQGRPDIRVQVDDERIVASPTEDGRSRCTLEVDVGVVNNTTDRWTLDLVIGVLDQERIGFDRDAVALAPESGTTFTLTRVAAPITTEPCPSIDDIDLTRLSFDFERTGGEFGEIRRTIRLD